MKLRVFQKIVELNQCFDQLAAGLWRLQLVPFSSVISYAMRSLTLKSPGSMPTESSSTTSRRWSRMTRDGLTVFNANSVKSSRIGTTSTSKSKLRKSSGSVRDFLRALSSFPIGTCLTKIATTMSSQDGKLGRARRNVRRSQNRRECADEEVKSPLPCSS